MASKEEHFPGSSCENANNICIERLMDVNVTKLTHSGITKGILQELSQSGKQNSVHWEGFIRLDAATCRMKGSKIGNVEG